MKSRPFKSALAHHMTQLVDYKRIQGYDYTHQAQALGYFDRFLHNRDYSKTILTKDIVNLYIADTHRLMPSSQRRRLTIVRLFSRYLQTFQPESYVIDELPVKPHITPRYHIYSNQDIGALLQCAQKLKPHDSIRPHCFYTLIGLLYVTGLRISEALALDLEHVDIDKGLLFVQKGKFAKQRYIAIAPSTGQILRHYLEERTTYNPSHQNAPFFIAPTGKRLNYNRAYSTFRRMIRACNIHRNLKKLPRLHDLRHSFACQCLISWYKQGDDVNAYLPILAAAMGHVHIQNTQIYLHISNAILRQAAQRFHHTFTTNSTGE